MRNFASRDANRARVMHQPCPSKDRGRREDRVSDAPAASHAKVKSIRVSHHRFAGAIRPSLRNGFNGFLRALLGDRACLPPSPASLLANLTPASGRQDHTTSPSANATPRQERRSRPPHLAPRFVTIASAPPRDETVTL